MARAAALSAPAVAGGRILLAAPMPRVGGAIFEEISPSASGITWVHENAMSDERYLHLVRQDCPLPPGTHVVLYTRDSGGKNKIAV